MRLNLYVEDFLVERCFSLAQLLDAAYFWHIKGLISVTSGPLLRLYTEEVYLSPAAKGDAP